MIKTEVKNLGSSKKELKVTLPKEDFEQIREEELKNIRKEVQIPGFRKGKAPLGMVRRRYGAVVEGAAMEKAAERSLLKGSILEKIDIVGVPEVKEMEFDDEKNLVVTFHVETVPEIELKKYKGLEIMRDKYIITDKFVDDKINELLQERAEVVAVDGPVEEGHRVIVDMQELDESGVPIVGRKYEDVNIKIGSGLFDKDLEMQLIGAKKGETRRIEKVYPDDFPQKDYAGKKELYDFTIKEIMEEKIPELTDEFVKDLGEESLNTVEDLKKRIRENLERQYEEEAKKRFEEDLIQTLLAENPFDIPQAIVDNYIDTMARNAVQQNPNLKMEDARRAYEPNAETMVKWYYLTKRIAEVENIEVSDEEVEKFIEENIEDEKMRKVMLDSKVTKDRFKEDLFYEKIVKFLEENNEIKENEIELD